MGFSSEAALKAALAAAAVTAVTKVEEQVYNEFAGSLNQYYGEFIPAEYIRTGALMGSLDRSGVTGGGGGASAEVFFNTPGYQTGPIALQSGRTGFATWSGGQVLETAMNGSHGGYAGGTAIWADSMAALGDIKGLLIAALKAQGL